MGYMFRLYRVIFRPEDDSIESKYVAHVSTVVDIPTNCCVRLLHLVPILLYLTLWDGKHKNSRFCRVFAWFFDSKTTSC